MAIRFDVAGERILRTSDLLNYNSTYTAFWYAYYVGSVNGQTPFAFDDDSAFTNYDQLGSSSGIPNLRIDGGDNYDFSTSLATATWYALTIVRETTTSIKLYINGTLKTTATNNVASRASITRMEFGGRGSTNYESFDGRVAVIKLWNVALTAGEVAAEVGVQTPVKATGVYAYYPTYTDGSALNDYSGNARHWTAVGTLSDEAQPPGMASSPSASGTIIPVSFAGGMQQLSGGASG